MYLLIYHETSVGLLLYFLLGDWKYIRKAHICKSFANGRRMHSHSTITQFYRRIFFMYPLNIELGVKIEVVLNQTRHRV